MGGASTAKCYPPQVAGKPGEISAGRSVHRTTRSIPEAAQFEEKTSRVEKGMVVRTVDGYPAGLIGDMPAATPAENPASIRALFLGRFGLCGFPSLPVIHLPQEVQGFTMRRSRCSGRSLISGTAHDPADAGQLRRPICHFQPRKQPPGHALLGKAASDRTAVSHAAQLTMTFDLDWVLLLFLRIEIKNGLDHCGNGERVRLHIHLQPVVGNRLGGYRADRGNLHPCQQPIEFLLIGGINHG